MRLPPSLASLTDLGVIEDVLRPLRSGKEAEVFLVLAGGERRVAKVYKDAQDRTFKHRAEYTEGRAVRNTRDQRAIDKRTKHGRAQDEAAWRSTEVEMIYRLRNAGVRVPTPHHFIDGVLIMELVADAAGNPAPRLGEMHFERDAAARVFEQLLAEVVRMLCAGVVHGDLSDYNVLMAADGPVLIDFPQAVDAASNQNARKLLLRDVDNLHRFAARFVPGWQARPYGLEMWELYARNQLTPDARLTGHVQRATRRADTDDVLALVGEAQVDMERRREFLALSRRALHAEQQQRQPPRAGGPGAKGHGGHAHGGHGGGAGRGGPPGGAQRGASGHGGHGAPGGHAHAGRGSGGGPSGSAQGGRGGPGAPQAQRGERSHGPRPGGGQSGGARHGGGAGSGAGGGGGGGRPPRGRRP